MLQATHDRLIERIAGFGMAFLAHQVPHHVEDDLGRGKRMIVL
jgi:hypothetical protein